MEKVVVGGVRLFLCSKLNRKVLELFARIGSLLLFLSLLFPYMLRGAYMFSRGLKLCAICLGLLHYL